MTQPGNVTTGKVTGRFIIDVIDGDDEDDEPDFIPATGTVTFTSSVAKVLDPTADPTPVTILRSPIVCGINADGSLMSPDGRVGVRLVATDNAALNPTDWLWNVTFNLRDSQNQLVTIPAIQIALPTDSVIDLSNVIPADGSTPLGTAPAEAAAAAAAASAAAAVEALSNIPTPFPKPLIVNVKDFGAVGDSNTDDTAAFQAAIAGAFDPVLGATSSIFIPSGVYVISAPLLIPPGGISIFGAGMNATTLRAPFGAFLNALITAAPAQFNAAITITDISLDGNSASGTTVPDGINLYGAVDCVIQRVRIINVSGNAIHLDGDPSSLGNGNKVLDSFVRSCGAGLLDGPSSTGTLVQGCDFSQCAGIAFSTAGSQFSIVGCTGSRSSIGFLADTTASAVTISGCSFSSNGQQGIYVSGGAGGVVITGTQVRDNVTLAFSSAGIEVENGAGGVLLSGVLSTGSDHQFHGLRLGTDRTAPATVVGCDFSGNVVGPIQLDSTTITPGDRISQVTGYSPAGAQVAPAVPASGDTFANPFPFDCTVWLAGGAVTDVTIGSTLVSIGTGGGGIRIPAGQSIAITYTDPPTWVWIGD